MAIFLKATWENIIMANYAVPVALLMPYLPKGVELDLYKGEAYVSLVGFMFKHTKLFNIPIPFLGTFEEINLRFYVIRKEGDAVKRGVVFINETIPYRLVAYIANILYKEHYTTVPTKHSITSDANKKQVNYSWQKRGLWNSIHVDATISNSPLVENSFAQFIFEHYYGYTKINENATEEYKLYHPSWLVNTITNFNVNCNFGVMYGSKFAILDNAKPDAVFIAEGSAVEVAWKRKRLIL